MRADLQLLREWFSGYVEVQTCGRRTGDWGPWQRGLNLDRWYRDRWGTLLGRRFKRWLHHHETWGYKLLSRVYKLLDKGIPYQGGTLWEWPWYPRTCSFCGGVHPADALRLVHEGWEVEWSDKGYKAYMNPPGYRAAMSRIMDATRKREPTGAKHWSWSPVPPVKLYTQHFTEQDAAEFNAALAKRRASR